MIHIVGEILIDEFVSATKEEKFPGGAPFNVASNVKHFGGNVSFYGSVGKDENGTYLSKIAKQKNFDQLILTKIPNRDTTIAKVELNNGERSFSFIRDNGTDYILSLAKMKKLNIQKDDIVHIGSLMLSSKKGVSFFARAAKYVKECGAYLSFDVNYRDDIFEDEKTAKRIFKKMIKISDIIKISTDELDILSNKKRLEAQVKNLIRPDQIAFISRGSKGSCFYNKDNFIFQNTIPVEPVDTTGAGDAFYSYCIFELDRRQMIVRTEETIKNILFNANIVGAFATQKKGAINVVPTLDEIEQFKNGKIKFY